MLIHCISKQILAKSRPTARCMKLFHQCFRRPQITHKTKWIKILQSNIQHGLQGSSKGIKFTFGVATLIGGKIFLSDIRAYCDAEPEPDIGHDRIAGGKNEDVEEDPHFSWSHFWKLLKPQWHYFLAAISSALVVALTNIQIPTLIGEVVNVVAEFAQREANEGRVFMDEIASPSIKIIKAYITQAVFTFMYITFLTRMGERIAVDLRQELFVSLLHQDIAFYDEHKTGELVNRLTSDVQDFKSSFKMCVSQGMRSITQIIGCGISIYFISPEMAGLTALVVPSIIGVGTALGSLLRSLSRSAQQQVALSTGVADECLGNMRTVRAFAMEDEEYHLFSREVEKSRQLNEALGAGIGLFQAGSNLFLNGVVLSTLFIGGSQLSSGTMRAGDLMAFLVSAQTIQRSLSQLSVLFGYFVRGVSAGARVFEFIDIEPTMKLKGGDIIPYHSLIGDVELKDVSFSYPTRPDQEVLSRLNLKVPSGHVLAIVGASGGGKSTIAQLLERFYDVSGGSISIDGHDIRTLDPSWLRGKMIGYINQEPVLFATSVMENIRYGNPKATDEEVIEAAKTANAHEFIQGFGNGYSTIMGERGVNVSGGQKQRIAIARALLKNPTVLVLDEATSALDAESEAVVQAALEKCVTGRTVIVIAHRLSTIKNADLIAVICKGKLAELGNHKSLKKKGGIYADLIRQQERENDNKGSWSLL